MVRQNARDVLGVEQDASLRALKISEIMLEEAVATCICAELSCKVFEKGLDEYREESKLWEGMYRDLLEDYTALANRSPKHFRLLPLLWASK